MKILPCEGFKSPNTIFIIVVFPAPDFPIIKDKESTLISRLISFIVLVLLSLWDILTFFNSIFFFRLIIFFSLSLKLSIHFNILTFS